MTNTFDPEHFPVALRPRMFGILLSSVLHIRNSPRSDRLRIYHHNNLIRLLAGRLIVVTAGEKGLIWLSMDPETLLPIEDGLTSWRRDTPATRPASARGAPYPEYKRPPSINGYYRAEQDLDGAEWLVLRQSHFRYLDVALDRGPAPDHRTAHQPELLDRLATNAGDYDTGSLDSQIRRSRLSSVEDRRRRLRESASVPSRVKSEVGQFQRNSDVVAEALFLAGDTCDQCLQKAPFCRVTDGSPYLEVHHCVPLFEGGEDTIENAIAVCPTCHRRLHIGMTLSDAIRRAQNARRQRYA